MTADKESRPDGGSPHTSINTTDSTIAPVFIDAEQLAARLGKPKKTVYAWHAGLGLPAIRLGRSLLFDVQAVDAWLERKRVGDWRASS